MSYKMEMPLEISWAGVCKVDKREITLTPEYIDMFNLAGDCLKAITTRTFNPLLDRLYELASPLEKEDLEVLGSQAFIKCKIDSKDNFILYN